MSTCITHSKIDCSTLPSEFIEIYSSSVNTFNVHFSYYIMKINENLHSFIIRMNEPKGDLDDAVIQREKRIAAEFSRRFARDYLYPTQLKAREFQSEYLNFISGGNCKIAQSMVLRPLVLSVLKKMSSCTQAYLRFLQRNNSWIFVRLEEILNLISHSFEIMKRIIDHQILKNSDTEKLCSALLKYINNRNIAIFSGEKYSPIDISSQTSQEKMIPQETKIFSNNVQKSILKKNYSLKNWKSAVRLKSQNQNQFKNKKSLPNSDNYSRKFFGDHSVNASCTKTTRSPLLKQNDGLSKLKIKSDRFSATVSTRDFISETFSKLTDHLVKELIAELVHEITENLQEIAIEVFDNELNDC